MSHNERPALLLVEDDAVLGPLVVQLLEPDYNVRLAADGQQGLHQALTGDWEVLVIDRRLPGLDGVELIRSVRAKGIGTPILVLTALGSIDDKVAGLDAGANDYMTKPFDAVELHARLRALTRTYPQHSSTVQIGDWELDPGSRSATSPYGRRIALTAREAELLATLAREPQRVFSREELIKELFAPDDLPGVVDTYVHYLRRKFSKSIVRTVHGVGYQMGEGLSE